MGGTEKRRRGFVAEYRRFCDQLSPKVGDGRNPTGLDWTIWVTSVRMRWEDRSSISLRRSKSIKTLLPILYLKSISTGDFSEALAALLGKDAAGYRVTKDR